MKYREQGLHCACVEWFDYQYPELKSLLFHPANEGKRDPQEGNKLRKMGMRKGVPDLVFCKPKVTNGEEFYSVTCGIFIEFKYGAAKQTKDQKAFEELTLVNGYKYHVVRTLEDFQQIIKNHLE